MEVKNQTIVFLAIILVVLILAFGDYCIMGHVECCMAKDAIQFNHNIICKLEDSSDEKCTKLYSFAEEAFGMEMYKLTNKNGEMSKKSLSDLHNAYPEYNIWFVKKEGHFTRYLLISQVSNLSSYSVSKDFEDTSYEQLILFVSDNKCYVGLITVQNMDMYILIK